MEKYIFKDGWTTAILTGKEALELFKDNMSVHRVNADEVDSLITSEEEIAKAIELGEWFFVD